MTDNPNQIAVEDVRRMLRIAEEAADESFKYGYRSGRTRGLLYGMIIGTVISTINCLGIGYWYVNHHLQNQQTEQEHQSQLSRLNLGERL